MTTPQTDDGVDELGMIVATCLLILATIVLLVLVLLFASRPAGAAECRERPGDSKTYWSYRLIAGQRCWYPGEGRKPKTQLHWPDEPKPKKLKGDPVFNQIRADASGLDAVTWHQTRAFDQAGPLYPPLNIAVPDEPDACCWPQLNEFDRRFTGEPR